MIPQLLLLERHCNVVDTVLLHQITRYINSTKRFKNYNKKYRNRGNTSLDFAGVSTELNLSDMMLQAMYLGVVWLYLSGLSDTTKRKKNWKAFIFYKGSNKKA